MNFKGKQYTTLESNLNELVKIFNNTKLNDIAAQYVSGQPVNDVNTATVLAQHKFDKASTLPNFAEYRAMGIDLSVTMPDCTATKSCLDELTATVAEYQNSQYGKDLQFISYDKKIKQFTINPQGKTALDRTVITLTTSEEKIYKSVVDLHQMLASVNPNYKWNLLSDKIVNDTFNHELRIDDVVYYIQQQGEDKRLR